MNGFAPRGKGTRRLWVGVVGSVASCLLTGCAKPLLSPRDERSQYDRYDVARGQYEPQFIEDEFGRRKPNLRGRLAPKD